MVLVVGMEFDESEQHPAKELILVLLKEFHSKTVPLIVKRLEVLELP